MPQSDFRMSRDQLAERFASQLRRRKGFVADFFKKQLDSIRRLQTRQLVESLRDDFGVITGEVCFKYLKTLRHGDSVWSGSRNLNCGFRHEPSGMSSAAQAYHSILLRRRGA